MCRYISTCKWGICSCCYFPDTPIEFIAIVAKGIFFNIWHFYGFQVQWTFCEQWQLTSGIDQKKSAVRDNYENIIYWRNWQLQLHVKLNNYLERREVKSCRLLHLNFLFHLFQVPTTCDRIFSWHWSRSCHSGRRRCPQAQHLPSHISGYYRYSSFRAALSLFL